MASRTRYIRAKIISSMDTVRRNLSTMKDGLSEGGTGKGGMESQVNGHDSLSDIPGQELISIPAGYTCTRVTSTLYIDTSMQYICLPSVLLMSGVGAVPLSPVIEGSIM